MKSAYKVFSYSFPVLYELGSRMFGIYSDNLNDSSSLCWRTSFV